MMNKNLVNKCNVADCECEIRNISLRLCEKHYRQYRIHGEVGARNQVCQYCGSSFRSEHKKKYCSPICGRRYKDRIKNNRIPLSEYLASVRNNEHYFNCIECGKESHRIIGGKNRKRGYKNRYCSMECKRLHLLKQSELHRPSKYSKVYFPQCKNCNQRFSARSNIKKYCSDECRISAYYPKDISPRPCKCCGAMFNPIHGSPRRTFCSSECSKAHYRKLARKKYGKNSRSRARKYGVEYQPVDRISVFSRDGWKCQICGAATPERLLGTTNRKAPELDHRIPLSRGGGHTYENTQCACRQCNISKGNTSEVGQYQLFTRTNNDMVGGHPA